MVEEERKKIERAGRIMRTHGTFKVAGESREQPKYIQTGAGSDRSSEKTWGSEHSREPPKCQEPQGTTVQQAQ